MLVHRCARQIHPAMMGLSLPDDFFPKRILLAL
jgi:hypothetical protein